MSGVDRLFETAHAGGFPRAIIQNDKNETDVTVGCRFLDILPFTYPYVRLGDMKRIVGDCRRRINVGLPSKIADC